MNTTGDESVQLRSGEYLSHVEASEITAARPTSVVVIGGTARSGKTSLMAGLFALLHKGPIGDYLFAGSRTLSGFEQRCHLATLNSGLDKADMERTKVHEDRFLHTRLFSTKHLHTNEMLFCDIPGEAFEDAANNADDCKRLGILHRADSFSLLIDGEKASEKKSRQSAFIVAESLLSQCLDQQMLGSNSVVQLVVSKWDLVESSGESSVAFVNSKLKRLESIFKDRFRELSFFRIAVHAWSGGGVDTHDDFVRLLDIWMRLRPPQVSHTLMKGYKVNSEFDRFGTIFGSK